MTTKILPVCPLGLTEDDLSRWRDSELGVDKMRRVDGHILECPFCQERLMAYERMGAGLRALPTPDLDGDRFWHDLHLRLEAAPVPRVGARRASVSSRSALAAIAAILLITLGFTALFRSIAGHPPAAAVTPFVTPPATALTWTKSVIESGFKGSGIAAATAFSESDGKTAYSCIVPQGSSASTPRVWVTHDHASHWQRAADVPITAVIQLCNVWTDQLDPSMVTVSIDEQTADGGNSSTSTYSFVSLDGAAHWQPLRSPPDFTPGGPTATYHGHTYALYQVDAGSIHSTFALAVSDDHLRTWRRIDLPFQEGLIRSVASFEVNPATGSILALTTLTPLSQPTNEAWTSDNGGAHWRAFPLPFGSNGIVSAFATKDEWHVCDYSNSGKSRTTYCTLDGGRVWPPLPDAPRCGPCASGEFDWWGITSIAPEGTMLLTAGYSSDGLDMHTQLFALTPGTTSWTPLGLVPRAFVFAAAGGELWCLLPYSLRDGSEETVYTATLPT